MLRLRVRSPSAPLSLETTCGKRIIPPVAPAPIHGTKTGEPEMGRPKKQNREPFWRTERDCWFVHVGSRTLRLSPDKDEAWRLWHEIMAKPPEHPVDKPEHSGLAVEIID